jgi:hypothetical protein
MMSINVIVGNCSDCKYVEIFTHRVGSISSPSRRIGFIRGTNIIIIIIIIIIIQFFFYLCAESTALRPITNSAQCTCK